MRTADKTSYKCEHSMRFLASTAVALLLIIFMMTAIKANATANTVVVKMSDRPTMYVPDKLTIKVGTTVVWKNTGRSLHDVTTKSTSVQNINDIALPPDVKPFDSGFIPPGGSWSYPFSVPGHYEYTCVLHENDHMIGEITVTK